eukprot:362430-Chlamydomonas_euryale.AAC.15
MCLLHVYFARFLARLRTLDITEVQIGRLEATDSNCLCRIVSVKLTDRHRLRICEERGTGGRWPRGTTAVTTGSWEHYKNSEMYSSPIRGFHEEGSSGGAAFQDFRKLTSHAKLIPWPEISAAAAERALDRQALRDANKQPALVEFKMRQQVERTSWSSDRRDGGPKSAVDPGLGLATGALCDFCDLAAEDVGAVASGKASVTETGRLPALTPACRPVCLPALTPACRPACLPSRMPVAMPACPHACLSSCLPAFTHACRHACLPSRMPVALPACPHACL